MIQVLKCSYDDCDAEMVVIKAVRYIVGGAIFLKILWKCPVDARVETSIHRIG